MNGAKSQENRPRHQAFGAILVVAEQKSDYNRFQTGPKYYLIIYLF